MAHLEFLKELHEQLSELGPALTFASLLGVAGPFIFYSYVWWYPIHFGKSRLSRYLSLPNMPEDAVLRFRCIAGWLKIPQVGGMYLLAAGLRSPLEFPHCDLIFVVGLIACSFMDYAIMNAIGSDGVFYGIRLGKTIPWVEGFPFNMGISDPQYRAGQVRALLVAYAFRTPGAYFACVYLIALYQYMCYVERAIPDTPGYQPEKKTENGSAKANGEARKAK